MKFFLIITTLLLIVHINAQPDYYLDHTFKTELCVGPVWDMTLLPNNKLFVSHRSSSSFCNYGSQYSYFAKVDNITGLYEADFYSSMQQNAVKVSNINDEVYVTFFGRPPPKVLSNGQQDWRLFNYNINFIETNDIIWLPKENKFLLSGLYSLNDRPRNRFDPSENECMIKVDEGFRLDNEFSAPIVAWVNQSDTIILNISLFLENLSDGRVIFQAPGSNTANGHTSDNGVFVMWTDGTIDTSLSIKINQSFLGTSEVRKYIEQKDGKIVLIVLSTHIKENRPLISGIMRIHPNGDIDTTFNNTFNITLNGQTVDPQQDGSGSLHIYDAVQLENDTMILVGEFTEYQGFPRNGIVMTDKDGYIIEEYFNGSGFENLRTTGQEVSDHQMRSILAVNQDTIFVGGYFDRYNGEMLDGYGGVVKLIRQETTSTANTTPEERHISVSPNPFRDNILIEEAMHEAISNRSTNVNINITDIKGTLIFNESIDVNQSINHTINTNSIPVGAYILTLTEDHRIIHRSKIVKIE